jgi:hypothetical protein
LISSPSALNRFEPPHAFTPPRPLASAYTKRSVEVWDSRICASAKCTTLLHSGTRIWCRDVNCLSQHDDACWLPFVSLQRRFIRSSIRSVSSLNDSSEHHLAGLLSRENGSSFLSLAITITCVYGYSTTITFGGKNKKNHKQDVRQREAEKAQWIEEE